MKLFIFACAVLLSSQVFCFPEMVRHGYVNCTSCHFNPNGGGILNEYGRVQSEQLLSNSSEDGEGNPLHGLAPSKMGMFSVGGDFRAIQVFQKSLKTQAVNFMFMQGDTEVAANGNQWALVGTLGLDPSMNVFSRRHYALYQPNEKLPFFVKFGKFIPAYGINLPDHIVVTRDGIGLGQGTDTYGLEVAWLGEYTDLFAAVLVNDPKGVTIRGSVNLSDRYKVGASYLRDNNHALFGPYAILGFTPKLFALLEWDFELTDVSAGGAGYARLDYEIIRGFHAYVTGEWQRKNFKVQSGTLAWGGGVQFFPRPHFELRAEYSKRHDVALTGGALADFGWLLMHYYL